MIFDASIVSFLSYKSYVCLFGLEPGNIIGPCKRKNNSLKTRFCTYLKIIALYMASFTLEYDISRQLDRKQVDLNDSQKITKLCKKSNIYQL